MNGRTDAAPRAHRIAGTRTLTPTADRTVKTVPVEVKKALVFFVGGAADKESYYFQGPNNNVRFAKDELDLKLLEEAKSGHYESVHLDYSNVKGEGDIAKYVIARVPSKALPVYIVGHSLGAWNGAHLSAILTGKGYNVAMLITLDPVGKGIWVSLGSDIYWDEPKPAAKYWINIWARPKKPDQSDTVAEFGKRWYGATGADLKYFVDINHLDARLMFVTPSPGGASPCQQVATSIREYMKT